MPCHLKHHARGTFCNLVVLDPALIVSPPSTSQTGYVPIVVRQETAPLDMGQFELLTLDDLFGRYERQPPENLWHGGEITGTESDLL